MKEQEIKGKLKHYILHEILRNADYPLADNEAMISGGLIDSFSLVHIAVFVENEFSVKIPDTDLTVENMDTIEAMAQRILQELD